MPAPQARRPRYSREDPECRPSVGCLAAEAVVKLAVRAEPSVSIGAARDSPGARRAQALRRPRGAKGVSLEVRRGEVVCIIGPSGSGKTTFLRCLNHLERIDGGRIEVDGELVGYRERPDGTLVEEAARRSRASARRSASSSSASTSGRT